MSTRRLRLTPLRRHLAAISTIAVSTAFLAVMLLAGVLMQQSRDAGALETYRGADLVAVPDAAAMPEVVEQPEIPEAEGAWPLLSAYAQLEHDGARSFVEVRALPPTDASPTALLAGRHAEADGEVVLSERTAKTLGVSAGDAVSVQGAADEGELTVVGVAAHSSDALIDLSTGQVYVTEHSQDVLLGGEMDEQARGWMYSLSSGTDAEAVAAEHADAAVPVRSLEEQLDEARADSGGMDSLAVVVGAFVLIALITAAVVVGNIFTVTLAQRIRALALLRTLGATRPQVATTVMRESVLVGLLGAVLGTVLGHALVQAVIALCAAVGWVPRAVPVPLSLSSTVLPVVAGVLITAGAALSPLRRATGVTPLQALRPVTATAERRMGVVQWVSLAAFLLGTTALLGGTLVTTGVSTSDAIAVPALLAAIGGGALSFLGVLGLLSVAVTPMLRTLRGLVPRGAVPGRLALANAGRNPRRTSATVAALVIGTTLMTMMAVGASTAETSLVQDLASRKPIDVVVRTDAMPEDAAERVAAVDGIEAAQAVTVSELEVGAEDTMSAFGVSPEQVRDLSARPDLAGSVRDGVLVTGEDRATRFGLEDGQQIAVPSADGGSVELTVQVEGNLDLSEISPADAERIGDDGAGEALFAAVAEPGSVERGGAQAADIVYGVEEVISTEGFENPRLSADGMEREVYGTVLDVLLAITLGLLATAVVVALLGVMSTLSLSVIERTGEHGLLRALGTTRAQMQQMLLWEGTVLGLLGAVLGAVLGTVYGLLGVTAVLGSEFPTVVTIPWLQLAVLLVGSLAAGALASVLPGRAAARTRPALALAAAAE